MFEYEKLSWLIAFSCCANVLVTVVYGLAILRDIRKLAIRHMKRVVDV